GGTAHVEELAAFIGQDEKSMRSSHWQKLDHICHFCQSLPALSCGSQQETVMTAPLHIGILIFPNVTQLDATGPAQVLSRAPGAKLHMIWKTRDPVPTDAGFSIVPTTTFADCPQLDVICVPGGGGQVALMTDHETLDFLRKQAETARYVTSVCTGSLVLGAAGLLKGYRSACHWAWREVLSDV